MTINMITEQVARSGITVHFFNGKKAYFGGFIASYQDRRARRQTLGKHSPMDEPKDPLPEVIVQKVDPVPTKKNKICGESSRSNVPIVPNQVEARLCLKQWAGCLAGFACRYLSFWFHLNRYCRNLLALDMSRRRKVK
jgi:hypothetical protein